MSASFEGLGPETLVPTLGRPLAQLGALGLSADEGFVLSRVDGKTSLGSICQLVPFAPAVTARILLRLFELGAIEVPGVARPQPKAQPPPSPPPQPSAPLQAGKRRRDPTPTQPFKLVGASRGAAGPPRAAAPPPSGPIELSPEQMRRIDEFVAALGTRDAFQLLDIDRKADERAVKRAYFKLSREFHPDRFFGKNLGEYGERLSRAFQAIKAAFELLSDAERRAAYEESASKGGPRRRE
jgi:hypothetical protein